MTTGVIPFRDSREVVAGFDVEDSVSVRSAVATGSGL